MNSMGAWSIKYFLVLGLEEKQKQRHHYLPNDLRNQVIKTGIIFTVDCGT